MDLSTITPAIFCKNEEYWIHYVLRDLLKVFGRVVMLDTGSKDATVSIAQETAKQSQAKFDLIQEDFGDDASKIGNSPNILRAEVKTFWMLLLAGDEILREEQLLKLRDIELDSKLYKVGMIEGYNVFDDNGMLKKREKFNADKFFCPDINWYVHNYPDEGYGQHVLKAEGTLGYLDSSFYYWHVRHCKRSTLDATTYYRLHKLSYYTSGYYGDSPPLTDMPDGWLGDINPEFPNPYLVSQD